MSKYVIVSNKSWSKNSFDEMSQKIDGKWIYIDNQEDLTLDVIENYAPSYIFFFHWSYRIPREIYENYECVIFHMTDVPYGRGGSPLQNLISREIYETKLTALKCVEEMDAGPVYLKRPLSLYGSAQEIYMRASVEIESMIEYIIENKPEPVAQQGDPVLFKRRKPEDGDISDLTDMNKIHDYIRMLDAEGYPDAFAEIGGLRLEFTRASLKDGYVHADVKIKIKIKIKEN